MLVITNNPMVKDTFETRRLSPVEFHDIGIMDLFVLVRDRVHIGHSLLTHPLSGSVRPHETHYKSIGITDRPSGCASLESLELIESAIEACRKVPLRYTVLPDRLKSDFQIVDLTLILSVFE